MEKQSRETPTALNAYTLAFSKRYFNCKETESLAVFSETQVPLEAFMATNNDNIFLGDHLLQFGAEVQ
jgi:hypothetical protein